MKKEIIYNKLVRDKIPDVIERSNDNYIIHFAKDDEYREKLLEKLQEEVTEFIEEPCIEELADILEVIDSLKKIYNFSNNEVENIKKIKRIKRGGFAERVILEKVIKKNTEIRKINLADIWKIRHEVMWPDRDIDYIKLKNDDEGFHFGLFVDEILVSVISLFITNNHAQFRKFATLEKYQGKGYGSKLLEFVILESKKYDVKSIWCNARKEKVSFYKKFNLEETEKTFIRGGKEYIVLSKNLSR